MNNPMPLAIFVICEVVYVWIRLQLGFSAQTGEIQQELVWTALRLAAAAVMFWIISAGIDRTRDKAKRITPRIFWVGLMMLAPILVADQGMASPARYVFAFTSLAVGLHEELAYRGVLQNILVRDFGVIRGLLISNVAFVCYHFGIDDFTAIWAGEIFLAGMILGVAYHLTGSLLLVILLHAAYDALISLSPITVRQLPDWVGLICLGAALAGLVFARRKQLPRPLASLTQPGVGKIKVRIVGGIVRPGTYYLPPGAKLGSAVKAGLGLSPAVAWNHGSGISRQEGAEVVRLLGQAPAEIEQEMALPLVNDDVIFIGSRE
jgi:membrane protease YdiL (CAAX protease family)